MDESTLEYLTDRQCARQWQTFLGVLASELESQLPDSDLRALMHRVGLRFADEAPMGKCETIDDLQFAMGKIWVNLDWGWTTIEEQPNGLAIRHNCAPLRAAFGQNALRWTPAFLEGVYQRWFEQVGSSPDLKVHQVSEPDLTGCIDFRLAR